MELYFSKKYIPDLYFSNANLKFNKNYNKPNLFQLHLICGPPTGQDSYLAVTASYINENWIRKNIAIAHRPFKKSPHWRRNI